MLNRQTPSDVPSLHGWGDDSTAAPYLEGNFAPVAEEVTVTNLAIEGELPRELAGRYVRNGPNPQGPVDPAAHHWFLGAGMVHGIRLEDGRARWYRNRYVEGGPNTHVIGFAGTTLAIVEAGAKPVELTSELQSVGEYDFHGTLTGGYTAHPKLDPDTGELHAMTYGISGPPHSVTYVVANASGRVTRAEEVPVAGPIMLHDMSLTPNWAVVYDLPVTMNLSLFEKGFQFPMMWNPDYGARVGLLPRDGGAEDVIWCEVPLCYVFHPMNAFETAAGEVVLDVCRYDRMMDGNFNGPFANDIDLSLERWTVNPDTRRVGIDLVDARAQEFPRCHPQLNGKPYRYGYTVSVEGRRFPSILKHDLESGTVIAHDLGARSSGEAVFVPRAGARTEDDGYLMAWVYDPDRDASEFLVLDAQEMRELARVRLPVRVPYGFHGSWIEDA